MLWDHVMRAEGWRPVNELSKKQKKVKWLAEKLTKADPGKPPPTRCLPYKRTVHSPSCANVARRALVPMWVHLWTVLVALTFEWGASSLLVSRHQLWRLLGWEHWTSAYDIANSSVHPCAWLSPPRSCLQKEREFQSWMTLPWPVVSTTKKRKTKRSERNVRACVD